MWGATPVDLLCRIQFKRCVTGASSPRRARIVRCSIPAQLGGMNWGSVSVDRITA